MNRRGLTELIIIIAALNFYGCGGAAEQASSDGKAGTNTAAAPSPAPTADVVTASADAVPAPSAKMGVASSRPGASPASQPSGPGSSAPPSKAPTPQIGSGGNDLFLFTKARAAVNADPELKAANLIIEVKEGVVILSGAVASPALKAKAEELARGAGPKAVRNQLRVSAGQ